MYGSKQIFVDKDVENGRIGACDFLLHVCVCVFIVWVVVRLHILIIGDELKDSKKAYCSLPVKGYTYEYKVCLNMEGIPI